MTPQELHETFYQLEHLEQRLIETRAKVLVEIETRLAGILNQKELIMNLLDKMRC